MNMAWNGRIPVFLFGLVMIFLMGRESEARELRVYTTLDVPFVIKAEEGTFTGITVDILDLIMNELQIQHTVILSSTTRTIEDAKTGRADMILTISKNEERLSYLLYPEESYLDLSWHFFIRKTDEGTITYEQFDDLKGLTVGATQGAAYTPEFWDAGLTLDVMPEHDFQIDKLLEGRIDIVPMPTLLTLYQEKHKGRLESITYLPKPLKTKPYYNVFSQASDFPDKEHFMQGYDRIVRRMKDDGTIQRIFDEYLK